jgi:ATP-binding cassette, subfamily A (ABC1), member 3
MEEAAAIATRAAIVSRRMLTVGTPFFLCKKYGNAYHVHIVLKSAPNSSPQEMKDVEIWVGKSFPGARLDPFGSHQGQIKFEIPANTKDFNNPESDANTADEDIVAVARLEGPSKVVERGKGKSILRELFRVLENGKDDIGLQYYSIGATTLNDVFLNVVRDNNVKEEGSEIITGKGGRSFCCV